MEMSLHDLLLSSEIGTWHGYSIQDRKGMSTWFRVGKEIDESGEVFVATISHDGINDSVILKVNDDPRCLLYEYLIGLEVNKLDDYCPNFIKTLNFFLREKEEDPDDEEESKYEGCLLIEYAKGLTFGQHIKRGLSDREILQITMEVFHALKIAQEHISFAHYDLHPNNIILVKKTTSLGTKYTAKIIDFGYSHAEITNPLPEDLLVCAWTVAISKGVVPTIMDPDIDGIYLLKNIDEFFTSFGRSHPLFEEVFTFIREIAENNHMDATSRGGEVTNWIYTGYNKINGVLQLGVDAKTVTLKTTPNVLLVLDSYEEITKGQYDNEMGLAIMRQVAFYGQNFEVRRRIEMGSASEDEVAPFREQEDELVHDNDVVVSKLVSGYKLYKTNSRKFWTLEVIIDYISNILDE